MQVTAHDVRVFPDSESEQTWTTWTTGTHFWADPDTNTLHRYRTTLRNGNYGWVTADPPVGHLSQGLPLSVCTTMWS